MMRKIGKDGKFRVAVLQPCFGDEESRERLARIRQLLEEGAGADLFLLPELWLVGYDNFTCYEVSTEDLLGETITFLNEAAKEHGAYILGGSFVEKAQGKLYNTTVLIDPRGEIVATYRKAHLLSYRSRERDLLTPGEGITVVETEIGTLGIAICYDLRFPELFRALSERGAEVFLVPAAWPSARPEAWDVLCRARAVENQAYLIAGNGAGKGLFGHSMVVDPWGVKIASLGKEQGVLQTTVDLVRLRRFRAEFPAWQER